MDLDELLGIDPKNPDNARAARLVDADDKLLDDLIAARRAAGLTQDEVSARMGVSQSAVARIESGERDPHLSTLRRYALAVQADVEHVVTPDRTRRADAQASVNAKFASLPDARYHESYDPIANARFRATSGVS